MMHALPRGSDEAVRNRNEPKNFLTYLPQDESVIMGFGPSERCVDFIESQRSVDLLNRELSLLLKLNHAGFWRVVEEDISLLEFINSFLQFRSRWYDFPHHGYTGTGIIIGESELARRVFMVLYRMSSNNIGTEHKVITNLKENMVFHLSNLLDICGIYFHENPHLTTSLVNNAINFRPDIRCDFIQVLYNFFNMFNTMNQRCRTSLQICEGCDFGHIHSEFLEVVDFLNDAVVSMYCFVSCYEPASAFFCCPIEMSYGTEELIIVLATSHDSLIPILEQGLQTKIQDGDGNKINHHRSDISVRVKLLSLRILKFGWKLLESCFLDSDSYCGSFPHSILNKIFPASLEDPVVRADILVQTFRSIAGVSSESRRDITFLQSIENSYGIMSRIEHLIYKGWISTDSEQMEYLKRIISPASLTNTVSETSKSLKEDESDVIMESKLNQIREIFPDAGKGFLSTCLKVCDNNHELVIQSILDGVLHENSPEIQHLSTSYKNDKKKEKVIECNWDKKKEKVIKYNSRLPTFNENFNSPKVLSLDVGCCPLSPVSGRYVRKAKNAEIGEMDIFHSREMKDSKRLTDIISRYEYEDEYDDSFDDLGMMVMDSGFNTDEITVGRKCSTISTDKDVIVQPASNPKWKSQKKPQFYVKDGRNYSYNVAGSTAAWTDSEAFSVSRVQKELIHGLGQGGNIPIGALEKATNEEEGDSVGVVNELQIEKKGGNRSGQHGRGKNHSRKDRALRKHISSLGGF